MEKLKAALTPWIRVDTWHTSHPLDEIRFNRALKSAFDLVGLSITINDFREAMEQLSMEHHKNLHASYRKDAVEKFSQQAENICSYLRDNEL